MKKRRIGLVASTKMSTFRIAMGPDIAEQLVTFAKDQAAGRNGGESFYALATAGPDSE